MTMSKSANEIKIHCTLFGPQNKKHTIYSQTFNCCISCNSIGCFNILFSRKKKLFDAGQSGGSVIGILEQGTNHLFHFIRSEMGGQRTFAG